MTEPQSMEEYTERIQALVMDPNGMAEGTGLETASLMPCPFCAAPRFLRVRIAHANKDAAQEGHCEECGRSGKNLVMYVMGKDDKEPKLHSEFVQTDGPDPPEWLKPSPRRLRKDGVLEPFPEPTDPHVNE